MRLLHHPGIGRRPRVDHLQSELRRNSRNPAAGSEGGQQHRALLRRHGACGAGFRNLARSVRQAARAGAGAELPQRSRIARAPAQPVRRQNHRVRRSTSGRQHEYGHRHGSSAAATCRITRRWAIYGVQYQANQMAMAAPSGAGQPIIEVGGKLQFSLPGHAYLPRAGRRHHPHTRPSIGSCIPRRRPASMPS